MRLDGSFSEETAGNYQALRGVMCLLIVVNHFTLFHHVPALWSIWRQLFHNGAFEVVYFFLASGFFLMLRFPQGVSWRAYYGYRFRRLRRLYAAYMASNLLFAVWNVLTGHPLAEVLGDVLSAALFLQSTFLVNDRWGALNGAAWFVSCIFWIWLVFPLMSRVLLALNRRVASSRVYGGILLLGAGLYLACEIWLPEERAVVIAYISPWVRWIYVILGMQTAFLLEGWRTCMRPRYVMPVLLAAYLYGSDKTLMLWGLVYAVVLCCLLLSVAAYPQPLLRRLGRMRWLQPFLRHSMEIYLFHFFLAVCFLPRFDVLPLSAGACLAAFALYLASSAWLGTAIAWLLPTVMQRSART